MTVASSTVRAAAHPVVLTLRLRYEMQCGWPGPGSLAIRFPPGMLPARLPAGSVLVNDRATAIATSSSAPRDVALALPRRPQIMCDAIGPGTLTVVFTRSARVGNPRAAGSYLVRATHAADRFAGKLVVRA